MGALTPAARRWDLLVLGGRRDAGDLYRSRADPAFPVSKRERRRPLAAMRDASAPRPAAAAAGVSGHPARVSASIMRRSIGVMGRSVSLRARRTCAITLATLATPLSRTTDRAQVIESSIGKQGRWSRALEASNQYPQVHGSHRATRCAFQSSLPTGPPRRDRVAGRADNGTGVPVRRCAIARSWLGFSAWAGHPPSVVVPSPSPARRPPLRRT